VRLLVTRPQPDAARTAEALRVCGHDVLVAPVLVCAPVPRADLGAGPWAGVLITSANAARVLAGHPDLPRLRDLPLLAVGARTREAAAQAGFRHLHSAEGDAAALVALAAAHFKRGAPPLLYLAGEDRAADLADMLRADGLPVQTVVLYRMVQTERFPAELAATLAAGAVDGVLHYSRRSAAAYLRCAEAAAGREAALAPAHYCFSQEVGAVLSTAGATCVKIAPQPTEPALLGLIR
jgi:uroporphyrinogen-III synthase